MSILSTLIIPYVITLFLELILAWILGIRKKRDLLTVVLVNTLTNPLLNLILLYLAASFPYSTYQWAVPLMELLIWMAEGLLFRKFLKKLRHPFLFSACLNAVSFFGGGLLQRWLAVFLSSGGK